MYAKQATLHSLFLATYPALQISLTSFKKLIPWYVRRARESTCNCKSCENFKGYQEVLGSVAKVGSSALALLLCTILHPSAPLCTLGVHAAALHADLTLCCVQLFDPLLSPASLDDDDAESEDEGESELDAWAGKAMLVKLLDVCRLKSKSDIVKAALCPGAFDGAGKLDCINGSCKACGFEKLWSKGLRKHVVYDQGHAKEGDVKASAPIEFQSEVRRPPAPPRATHPVAPEAPAPLSPSSRPLSDPLPTHPFPKVKWMRIRSAKKTEPGEAKQSNYEARSGTVVEFLDEFERDVMRKFPHHRFTVKRQKDVADEFERNRCPGWVQCDVDFAMDGVILPPKGSAIQSDHWSPPTYTLFNQVCSWLETAAWVSRSSELRIGDKVTVEPAEGSQPGATQPAAGSCWAEVIVLPSTFGAPPEAVDGERLGEPPQPDAAGRHIYGVRRHGASADAPPELVERRLLRHRKLHTKAFVHISDDKTHDSHAAQTFMNKTFKYLEDNFVNTGKEKFVALHMHSDNAASHFKSGKTMFYVTTLLERLKPWAAAPTATAAATAAAASNTNADAGNPAGNPAATAGKHASDPTATNNGSSRTNHAVKICGGVRTLVPRYISIHISYKTTQSKKYVYA